MANNKCEYIPCYHCIGTICGYKENMASCVHRKALAHLQYLREKLHLFRIHPSTPAAIEAKHRIIRRYLVRKYQFYTKFRQFMPKKVSNL